MVCFEAYLVCTFRNRSVFKLRHDFVYVYDIFNFKYVNVINFRGVFNRSLVYFGVFLDKLGGPTPSYAPTSTHVPAAPALAGAAALSGAGVQLMTSWCPAGFLPQAPVCW